MSQIQGALTSIPLSRFEWMLPRPDHHLDACMVRHFGETADRVALSNLIYFTPFPKVLAAFIDCPAQMCDIYSKIRDDKTDEFIIFVRDSGMAPQFFEALRSFPNSDDFDFIRRNNLRKFIYNISFIRDIPLEYFFDDLKKDPMAYGNALCERAALCRTVESKSWMTGLLTEHLAKIDELSAGAPVYTVEAYEDLKNVINVTLKLMNNEDIDFENKSPQAKQSFLYLALSFNRYDIVDKLFEAKVVVDVDDAREYFRDRIAQFLEDPKRAKESLRRFLLRQRIFGNAI